MSAVSQFSPASFLFQGVKPKITHNKPKTTGTTSTTSTKTSKPGFGVDRSTISGGGGELSLGQQMKNLTSKVGKASSSWLQQTRQDLGLASKESKAFKGKHEGRGWDVKGPGNRDEFTPQKMDGKPVAFRVKDEETGKMVEKKGFLKPSGENGESFKLDGQKGEFDPKHIHDLAVNNDPKVNKESQGFRDKFEGKDWTAKHHRNGFDFSPADMNGKEVAFMKKDEKTGEMVEHRGIMKADPDPRKTALFKLEGQEGSFNNNDIREMAVNDSFSKGMKKEGWTVKGGGNEGDFSTQALNGREVSFKTRDENGKLVERRGVLDAGSDPESGKFKLKGKEGEFNTSDIKEMARNDKFAQEYQDKGWTVKDESNAHLFEPENLVGQNVAFRHPDPHGEMMTKMAKVQSFTMIASMGLSMLSMVGMSGMYSPMMMPEMAIMPMDMGMGMGAGLM